ncbi:MAG: single-stranded DNA-binding protein [Burkholderiaceae bacterium]|nr:single-stranded DNA-binding protein [Burkholderiaceae bacterium]
MTSADDLVRIAHALARAVERLRFGPPVVHVYNPLVYAWPMHEAYLRRFGATRKRVMFVGMNPGPFGMMQTGVPFGEVAAVRDWMRLDAPLSRPARQHPKRPIEGLSCRRSEVSGQRVWDWAASRFGSPEAFFEHAIVLNYCPLVFLAESGRNCTPDKLPAAELQPLQHACDLHLRRALGVLAPQWAIGIGGYAFRRLGVVLAGKRDGTAGAEGAVRIGQVLHPSPASPLANRGWAAQVDAQLEALGVVEALPAYRKPPDAARAR